MLVCIRILVLMERVSIHRYCYYYGFVIAILYLRPPSRDAGYHKCVLFLIVIRVTLIRRLSMILETILKGGYTQSVINVNLNYYFIRQKNNFAVLLRIV